jgi:LmbE family N-acetylglucosaminyl deacetylase
MEAQIGSNAGNAHAAADTARALTILKALAAGVDPHTGQVFPTDSVYQHADTVRALYRAIEALNSAATPAATALSVVNPVTTKPTKPSRPAPGNAGKPWTEADDTKLLADFDSGESVTALALAHGRSRFAIEARLARFQRIPMPSGLRQPAQSAHQVG